MVMPWNLTMKSIPQYRFHKTKYGDELLVDVVELRSIEKYVARDPVHTLTYYDITLITEGTADFVINTQHCTLQPGCIVSSIPGEVRGWSYRNALNGYALIFEESFLLSFFNDPNFLLNLSFLHPQRTSSLLVMDDGLNTRISTLILQIKKEIDLVGPKDNHILRAMLYETLMLLHRAYSLLYGEHPLDETVPVNRHVNAFIRLVNDEFKTERQTRYYADKLCVTANYLNEVVQKSLGISAKAYIRQKVTGEAERLLAYTTLAIVEIADRLHYSTASYFVRSFHKQTGLTPKQYREQNLNRN